MKKILLSAIVVMASITASATDLWTGSKHVSWGDGGLQLQATQFADAKAGDKIVVTYTGASDGIEFKLLNDFHRLPGSRNAAWINGDSTFEQFLTTKATAELKEYGLEIIGANLTITKVELLEGKDNVTENTVWTGYFWMNEWSTLEIVTTSFAGINWADYEAIRFCSEAGRTDYIINVKVNWEESGHIADANTMTMTEEYAELSLEGIDMAAKLAQSENFMVQCNKEGGEPFNFTSIELVPVGTAGISSVETATKHVCFDLAGRKVSNDTKGIVISNGKAYINK